MATTPQQRRAPLGNVTPTLANSRQGTTLEPQKRADKHATKPKCYNLSKSREEVVLAASGFPPVRSIREGIPRLSGIPKPETFSESLPSVIGRLGPSVRECAKPSGAWRLKQRPVLRQRTKLEAALRLQTDMLSKCGDKGSRRRTIEAATGKTVAREEARLTEAAVGCIQMNWRLQRQQQAKRSQLRWLQERVTAAECTWHVVQKFGMVGKKKAQVLVASTRLAEVTHAATLIQAAWRSYWCRHWCRLSAKAGSAPDVKLIQKRLLPWPSVIESRALLEFNALAVELYGNDTSHDDTQWQEKEEAARLQVLALHAQSDSHSNGVPNDASP